MKHWIGCWGLLLWSLIASSQTTPGVEAPLGAEFKVPRLLTATQSRVVFYRNASPQASGVMSVYVNGNYQASLQGGAFTALCLPPASVQVAARHVVNDQQVPAAWDVVNTVLLKSGDDVFIRVSEQSNGRALLQAVRADIALPELVRTREQQHTLPRVPTAVACQDAAPRSEVAKAEVAKVDPSKADPRAKDIVLSADALFPFGKSDVHTLSPNGRRLLDHLIDRIKTEFGKVDKLRIQITGHSDGIGAEPRNVQLSVARAQAIKSYFVEGGLKASQISVQGKGSQEPVVSCDAKPMTNHIACNKPNRRVVVSVKTDGTSSAP
jgi:outer membrane protein OmpA-like peptidoglycan-associated protein